MTITANKIRGSERLYELVTQARAERALWTNPVIRTDLATIALELEDAARAALSQDEEWADAWAAAAVLTLRRYSDRRRMNEADELAARIAHPDIYAAADDIAEALFREEARRIAQQDVRHVRGEDS